MVNLFIWKHQTACILLFEELNSPAMDQKVYFTIHRPTPNFSGPKIGPPVLQEHKNLRNITRKYQLMQAAACRYSNPDMIQIRVQTVVKSTKYKKYQIRPFRYLFVNRDYRFYRLSRFGSRLHSLEPSSF